MLKKNKISRKHIAQNRENDQEILEKIIEFDHLILHEKSRSELKKYLENPAQNILLFGENGVGLKTIALTLAQKIARGNRIIIEPKTHEKQKTKNINLDDIREIHKINQKKRRENIVVLVDESEKMTRDAPQAFLKLLEEPSEGIFYILTSHAPENLPATILSRVEMIEIFPANASEILQKNRVKIDQKKFAQIEFLAHDLPAETNRLLMDEKYFASEVEKVEIAKSFLSGNFSQKLKIVAPITTRENAQKIVLAIAKLLRFMSKKNLEIFLKKSTRKNINLLNQVLQNLTANGHIKTQLNFLATNWADEKDAKNSDNENSRINHEKLSKNGGKNV